MNRKVKEKEAELRAKWEEFLAPKGISYPSGKRLNALICLFAHLPRPVSQEEMIRWHEENELPDYDRQARHLAAKGWDVRSGNTRFTGGQYEAALRRDQLRLHSVCEPSPTWSPTNERRSGNLTDSLWNTILQRYKDHGCAVCGRKFDHYDKGHLRRDRGYVFDNIVPMCSECNNWGQEVEFKLYGLVARPLLKYFVKRGGQ